MLAAHGIRGELKCRIVTDFPTRRFKRGNTVMIKGQPHTIQAARVQGATVLLKLEDISDRDVAAALRGAEVEVPTLSGRKRLRVAPGTKHGTVQRLRGEGLPRLGGSGRGDIHYRFVLDVPGRLSREQEEAVQRLSEVMNGDPRARLFEGARAGAGERGGS